MANIVNKLAKYYKYCLYDEAKISAFTNLRKEDNIIVKLNGYEKLHHNYPTPFTAQEESAELTKLMLKAEMEKKKQLIYGYMFLTGKLADGTDIYTPLIYSDCKIERINGRIIVSIIEGTTRLNSSALMQFAEDESEKVILASELSVLISEHLTEESIKAVEKSLADMFPMINVYGNRRGMKQSELSVSLNRENAVILTTINKGLSDVIAELDEISTVDNNTLSFSSLQEVLHDNNDFDLDVTRNHNLGDEILLNTLPATTLDKSQFNAVVKSGTDRITAITGAPGTGKSSTIVGIATSYMLNNKSVLICSKQNSAVDVIYNKLQNICNTLPVAIRTGGKEQEKQLAETLSNLVNNKYNLEYVTSGEKPAGLSYVEEVYNANVEYAELQTLYKDTITERNNAYCTARDTKNILKKVQSKYQEYRLNNRLQNIANYQNSLNTMGEDDFVVLKRDVLRNAVRVNLSEIVKDTNLRRQATMVLRALEGHTLDRLDNYKEIFSNLLNYLPCWCTTSSDIRNTIPLVSGLFDVVIIDEASLCDIATCLPLLYRGKHAVVVGDDKQLKYLSFLSIAVNTAHKNTADLGNYKNIGDYRTDSIFDFASYFSNSGNQMLLTQYRSQPEIMRFSSDKFYNGRIRSNLSAYNAFLKHFPVEVQHVDGSVLKNKPVNNAECTAIINRIKSEIAENPNITIGVVSPFREQVKQLEKMIQSVFTLEQIRKNKITVGTAYSFQGEERDVVYISWVVADNSPIQSYTFVNKPNQFNVAITRGSMQVVNFISATNLPNCLLREYIEYCENVHKSCIRIKGDKTPVVV